MEISTAKKYFIKRMCWGGGNPTQWLVGSDTGGICSFCA